MQIESTITNKQGETFKSIYHEGEDPTENLDGVILSGSGGHCFYGDKLVIVKSGNEWGFPGGAIEQGETWQEAIVREVKEESNMKVLHQELIGYQDFFMKKHSLRHVISFCIVEPYGNFETDPDNDITEIKLIDPKDFKQYINWGEIGDRIMERAVELRKITGMNF